MKILILVFSGFDSLHGANLRIFHIIKEAEKRNHDIQLIVPDAAAAESCKKYFKSPVRHLNISLTRFSRNKIFKYPIFSIKAFFAIDEDYDVILGQSLPSILGSSLSFRKGFRFYDIPDLWSEYWLYSRRDAFGKLIYFFVRLAENFCIRKADCITTVTSKQRELLSFRSKADISKIKVVPEGVDNTIFRPMLVPENIYKKYNLSREQCYLICQGGIEAHDGMQFLVQAFHDILEKHPDVKVLIAGTGHYLKFLKKQIHLQGLDDYFLLLGWVDYSDMPYLMNIAALSLALLPDHDACRGIITIKLLESLASGTPIIAGDLPGIKSVVKHKESAYLINSTNPDEIRKAVCTLLEDKNLRRKLSENGLKNLDKFHWKAGAENVLNLMEQQYENFSM